MSVSVSRATYNEVVKYIYGVVVPLIVIFGLFGNIMTFKVLRRISSKSSTTCLLYALTAADSLYMVTTAVSDAFILANRIKPREVTNIRIRYLLPMETIGWSLPSYISNWIVVMISLERTIAVLSPMKSKKIWTKRTSLIAIVLACMVPTLSTSPRWVQARGVPVINNITNETDYKMELYFVPGMDIKFYGILKLINTYMLYVGPVCVVFICNICIIVGLYVNRRQMQLHVTGDRQRRENKVSRMVLLICVHFCICVIPNSAVVTYNVSTRSTQHYRDTFIELLIKVFYVLLVWNSAMNFLVYVMSSVAFRKEFLRILCGVFRRRKTATSMTRSVTKTDVTNATNVSNDCDQLTDLRYM
ncbi:hypothetical protein FSP39_001784 [Pinctada imbricata]|uniref:G-protein coupled receptors family 1 profile domain-containing protein n=1 Tax=Pinctada imbricata TaxID=66713 RepID=A0AA89C9I0_PINIB|nr:hypothetical protein FSP39_001784 [Pinctada imbricata]